MVNPLKVANDIWRKWDEKKIMPPMTWQQLRIKIDEYIVAGKDPYDILRGEPPSEEWMKEKGFTEEKPKPWFNMSPEAIVEEKEIPTFTPALLGLVENSWKSKKTNTFWEWVIYPVENGVLVGLRGNPRPHELFPKDLIEKMKYSEEERKYGVIAKLYFDEDSEIAKRAFDVLTKTGIVARLMRDSQAGFKPYLAVNDPDAVLEILASEGFDTSKIMVEKE